MQSRDRFTPDSGRDKAQMMQGCARWGARGPALRFLESAHVAEGSRLAGGFFLTRRRGERGGRKIGFSRRAPRLTSFRLSGGGVKVPQLRLFDDSG